jgi:hypothetical protein
MSAKILQFTPRPDNKLYRQPQAARPGPLTPVPKLPQGPKIPYLDSLKMEKTALTPKETKLLGQVGYFWDEQYQALYPAQESWDCDLVEKRGEHFFFLSVLPFNLYPSEYKVFVTIQELVSFLQHRG